MRFPKADAVEVAVSGDAVCVRTGNDVVRCHPDLRRPALPWTELPGAYFAFKGGQSSHNEAPPFCGILHDESIACFRFVGERIEPLGIVTGRFRGVRVGAATACGVDEHEDTLCWSLPTAASRAPLPTTRRLAAAEGLVTALDLWDDAGCVVLKQSGVSCWEGTSERHRLEVSVNSAMPAALRLGARIACLTYQVGNEIRCWRRGAKAWSGTLIPPRHTGASQAFVGEREACTVAWLGRSMECWDVTNTEIPHAAEPPPPVAPAPLPVVSPATTPPPRETRWSFHGAIPFSYGVGWYRTRRGTSQGSWLRFRALAAWGPEPRHGLDDQGLPIVGARRYREWAVGPYGEVAWHRVSPARQLSWGAGAIGIIWFSRQWALTPTLGWYQQQHDGAPSERGLAAGLGLDTASRVWGPLLFPVGLRLEARYSLGSGSERSWLLSGEADSLMALAAPVGMYLLATAKWRF